MSLFLNGQPSRALSNIRRDRNNGSTQLIAKGIILSFRELFQQLIDIYNEFSCFFQAFSFSN